MEIRVLRYFLAVVQEGGINRAAAGRIVIGCGELAAVQVLSEMIEDFHKAYPRVSYDIFTATADLVKEQIDIGVLLEPVDMEKFDFIRLAQKERWGVLMRPDAPLSLNVLCPFGTKRRLLTGLCLRN